MRHPATLKTMPIPAIFVYCYSTLTEECQQRWRPLNTHRFLFVYFRVHYFMNTTVHMAEIDWDQPGEILSPGCPHHPCLCIPGTRRLPILSPIKKYGWWNKNGCCHLYCRSGHFHNIKIIVNGSNMTPFFSLELDRVLPPFLLNIYL